MSTLTVQNIQGSSSSSNTISVASGHKISGNVTHGTSSVFPAGHVIQTVTNTSTYAVTVGTGGGGANPGPANRGANGTNSSIASLPSPAIALGGGGGGSFGVASSFGCTGGSGGGVGAIVAAGATGTDGQGFWGGWGSTDNASWRTGGGGGGAGGYGMPGGRTVFTPTASPTGTNNRNIKPHGGAAAFWAITGNTVGYAAGGGGGGSYEFGYGGSFIGGRGSTNAMGAGIPAPTISGDNRGSGGGGGGNVSAGGDGSPGVVIIRYKKLKPIPGSTSYSIN